jgi:hypothetical protein
MKRFTVCSWHHFQDLTAIVSTDHAMHVWAWPSSERWDLACDSEVFSQFHAETQRHREEACAARSSRNHLTLKVYQNGSNIQYICRQSVVTTVQSSEDRCSFSSLTKSSCVRFMLCETCD